MKNPNEQVAYWITEREKIRVQHDEGQRKPWTADTTLERYRFCNVRREDDRVTRWLKKYWRDPNEGHENMTAAMLLARMVNWPPTLDLIGFPLTWDPQRIVDAIHACMSEGKAWSAAYVVTTCGVSMDKALYVVQTAGLAAGNPTYTPAPADTLAGFWTRLKTIPGLGAGFLAAQVVADLKYLKPLSGAADWGNWATPGPGSRRGINRYFNLALDAKLPAIEWLARLHQVRSEVEDLLPAHLRDIHAQDWQNVMCEWDKYQRTVLGEGRPRSNYRPETAYEI